MASPAHLFSIAAEGGSIELYREANGPNPRYRALVVDYTPLLLDESESGASSRRDSGWLPTWAAAIEWLGRCPWPNLICQHVDPSTAEPIWTALQEYVDHTVRSIREGSVEPWCRHRRDADHPENSYE
jgi:hypothetical protein